MMACNPVTTCAKSVIHLKGHMGSHLCGIVSRGSSNSYCYCLSSGHPKGNYSGLSLSGRFSSPSVIGFRASHGSCFGSCFSKRGNNPSSFIVSRSISAGGSQKGQIDISFVCQRTKMRLLVPKQGMVPKIKCDVGIVSWPKGCASAGLLFSLLVCYSSSEPVHAEAAKEEDKEDEEDSSNVKLFHGKQVYTDYSIIGIPGDGRCLFRSVAHGACLKSGEPAPNECLQRQLADNLRARVADEFIKRREETEWFVEGDFDTYVAQIRKPHVWGGEPELFMASHVLKMPITVYMHDRKAGGLICIAEYGQEYGKENPIRVLYHGFGHYDALLIPGRKGAKSKI